MHGSLGSGVVVVGEVVGREVVGCGDSVIGWQAVGSDRSCLAVVNGAIAELTGDDRFESVVRTECSKSSR